jgi:hypothetical protein
MHDWDLEGLKKKAKEEGIKGYYKMNKRDLIQRLYGVFVYFEEKVEPSPPIGNGRCK